MRSSSLSLYCFVAVQVRVSSSNPSLMSREKISVVGADYRTRYPRLYALADEGRRRFEIQLSRRGVEKEAPDDIFPRRDNLKALKRSRKVLSLIPSSSLSCLLFFISYFYLKLMAIKGALACFASRIEAASPSSCNKIFVPRGNKRCR